jgi:hypothetical protein
MPIFKISSLNQHVPEVMCEKNTVTVHTLVADTRGLQADQKKKDETLDGETASGIVGWSL